MTLDKGTFRKVMGQFATGVTIATTRSEAGIAGLTVNSFTSVSLDPLLVLVCIDQRSQALAFFRASGIFAVNILAQEQEALSNCFAAPSEERYTYFCHAKYSIAATGAPILDRALGFIDARITAEYPGGDHVIFVGQVEAAGYDGQLFFAPGVQSTRDTLAELSATTSLVSQNGQNTTTVKHHQPLLYYQGQYHHLDSQYHHSHPEWAPQPLHE